MNFTQDLIKAKEFIDQKNYKNALDILMEVLDEDPDNPGALFLFGNICIAQDKRGLAYNVYRRCAALQPEEAAVWVNYGRCQEDSKEGWEVSMDCFKRALAINPKPVSYTHLTLPTIYSV